MVLILDGYEFATEQAKKTLVKTLKKEFPNCHVDIMTEWPSNSCSQPNTVVMGNWRFNKDNFPGTKTYGIRDGIGYIIRPK